MIKKVTVPNKKFLQIFPSRELSLRKRITTKFVFYECDDGSYWMREQPTIIAKLIGTLVFIPVGAALAVWAGIRELPSYGSERR